MSCEDSSHTVVITLDGDEVKLVFDGDEEVCALYGASDKLANQPELNKVLTSSGDPPRGTNLRALLTCNGGTLQYMYNNENVTYKIVVKRGPKQSEAVRFGAVTIVSFQEMGAGKQWKVLTQGEDFVPEAKSFIISTWGLETGPDSIHLACYVSGIKGRCVFEQSAGYWAVTPATNAIYFWVGDREESPIQLQRNMRRKIDEMVQGMEEMEHDIKRLKTVSGTAMDQMEIWDQRKELPIEIVKQCFPSVATDTVEINAAKALLSAGPVGPNESHVQTMWNGVMPHLVPATTTITWKDCRSPNGIQYNGRRHDIDLVLLTMDFLSILYLDTSIELKESIASEAKRSEVVLQLLDRFAATFDAQPQREQCWGLGMDASRVVFVRCLRDMSYSVSPTCELKEGNDGWDCLVRFLKAPSAARGYIPIVMPQLFGETPLALLAPRIYLLNEDTVCKVSVEENPTKQEHTMLKSVQCRAPFLAPHVKNDESFETLNSEFPWGFRMSRLQVPGTLQNESDVLMIASHIFWSLGALHHMGIVHRDVKPSNILYNPAGPMKYLLNDYGSAQRWRPCDSMSETATEAYSSIPMEFQHTATCMYHRDLESLFWSVFAMWLQVIKKREVPTGFRCSREADVSVLRDRKGAYVGVNPSTLHVPGLALLKSYLVTQADCKTLWQPHDVFVAVYEEGDSWDAFNDKGGVMGFLPCPPPVFNFLAQSLAADHNKTTKSRYLASTNNLRGRR